MHTFFVYFCQCKILIKKDNFSFVAHDKKITQNNDYLPHASYIRP